MPSTRSHLAELIWHLAPLVVIVPTAILAVWGSALLGPSFDEPADITAGYVFWRSGEELEAPGRPLLGLMLESLGLWVTWGENVDDWPGLPERDLDRLTAHVLSGIVPVHRMLWWARVPGMLAMALTALLVHRGALALWGHRSTALLATTLFCLLPSTLAHATRADGAMLSAMWVCAATVAGWRWLCRESSGWPALVYLIGGLLTDWALWLLIPFALGVVAVRAADTLAGRLEPAQDPTPDPRASRGDGWGGGLARVLHESRVSMARLLVGALVFWLVIVELTGNWRVWWDLWQSAVVHWTRWRSEALPLFFAGQFYAHVPLAYHPALILLKTPLWLFLLWALAIGWSGALRPPARWHALLYLHAGVLWMIAVGSPLLPARGYAVWVPLTPILCMVAAGALPTGPEALRLSRRALTVRWLAIALALGVGTWTILESAPHWHAQWNTVAWLDGGGRVWFAAPENDAGPAMPAVAEHLQLSGEGDELIFVAHCGRWSPTNLGLKCLFLPSHGLLLEQMHRFKITEPPPGIYVIAASLLMGQDCLYPGTYRWFRERPADLWIGGTVGLWTVEEPASGETDGAVGSEVSD
ncbi:hypothetical protein JXA47_05965 [Candidatus Sumerlaeota bacterium]|nr:hypothetical protein [Candidatus Sumerlaeota bacterium]